MKMILKYIIYVSTFSIVAAGTSYQYVRFVKPNGHISSTKTHTVTKSGSTRNSRSFTYPGDYFGDTGDILPDEVFLTPTNIVDFSYVPEELTQFSHELTDYHDPLLLTGNAAQAAVRILYGKGELFFADYPHVKALLENQNKRRRNGLAGNKLGSLRPGSPFHRFGPQVFSPYY